MRRLIDDLDAVRSDEAQPIMPLATISVTEDMATAMRLHRNGWRSVYHHEILVHGLAPEDLGSMLQQRLRWAQGTIQVFIRENPLVQRGLSAGQRLMYFATGWSYLSGFAALAYLAAPVLYLTLGILPVTTIGADFMWHLVPFLLANQLLFTVVGWKVKTFRGMQYSLALFPLWIRAVVSTVKTEVSGESLGFVVTPKTRQSGSALPLVRIQIWTMAILVAAVVIGCVRLMIGDTDDGGAIMLNIAWAAYDLVMLSAVLDAAFYKGFEPAGRAGRGRHRLRTQAARRRTTTTVTSSGRAWLSQTSSSRCTASSADDAPRSTRRPRPRSADRRAARAARRCARAGDRRCRASP